MRACVVRLGSAGFTLIELLCVISIIGILVGLAPTVHRVRSVVFGLDNRPGGASLSKDLLDFADATSSLGKEVAALAVAATRAGENGSLDPTRLQILCGNLLDADATSARLIAQVAARRPGTRADADGLTPANPDALRERGQWAEVANGLADAQNTLKLVEATLSQVFPCGDVQLASRGVAGLATGH
jgi:prepilin-type N-terminal cleavage/methylation domain-containing protein